MNNDPRGTIVQRGSILRIDDAFVDESVCFNNFSGYLLISYSASNSNHAESIQTLRLNISRNTPVLNSMGQYISLCSIKKGMWVDVVFSSNMTRSIPPQANAFLVISVVPQASSAVVSTERIAYIDAKNNFLYTGNPNDVNSQKRFVLTGTTSFTDRAGRPISINALRPGQMVKITHSNAQTASIPPQSTAYHIQLI